MELLPQPVGVGILECGSLLVSVLQGLSCSRPNVRVDRAARSAAGAPQAQNGLRAPAARLLRSVTDRSNALLEHVRAYVWMTSYSFQLRKAMKAGIAGVFRSRFSTCSINH